jgi:hypothetical protein
MQRVWLWRTPSFLRGCRADIASRLPIEELAPDEKRIRRALKILVMTLGHYVA